MGVFISPAPTPAPPPLSSSVMGNNIQRLLPVTFWGTGDSGKLQSH